MAQPKKSTTIVVLLIIVLLAAGTGIFLHHYNAPKTNADTVKAQRQAGSQTKQTINNQPATNGTTDSTNSQNNTNSSNSNADTGTSSTNGQASNSNSSSTTKTQPVTVMITAANQSGSTLQIRTQIDAVTNTATCNLTITSGSQTITRSSGVQALASSSSCQGFNIPTSSLPAGQWAITVAVSDDTLNLAGTANSSVTVQ